MSGYLFQSFLSHYSEVTPSLQQRNVKSTLICPIPFNVDINVTIMEYEEPQSSLNAIC